MENLLDYRESIPVSLRGMVEPVNPASLVGARILYAHLAGGDYGMGSSGYPSWRVLVGNQAKWLRLPIFGGGRWLHVNGNILEVDPGLNYPQQGLVGFPQGDGAYDSLFDSEPRILAFEIQKHSFYLKTESCLIELKEDPSSRPPRWHFSEKVVIGPLELKPEEDLRQSMVLSGPEHEGEDNPFSSGRAMRSFERKDPEGYRKMREGWKPLMPRT